MANDPCGQKVIYVCREQRTAHVCSRPAGHKGEHRDELRESSWTLYDTEDE